MRAKVLLFTSTGIAAIGVAAPALASGGGDGSKAPLGIPEWIWLPANLALFLFVLGRLIWPSLRSFLEDRGKAIKSELAEARHKLEEAEELRAQVLARLDQVEAEVVEIKERAERDGKAEAARIEEQTRSEEERFLKRVDDEISRRGAETRLGLAEETATLTAQLTRELLSREMTDGDRQRVLERSLTAMQSLQES